MHTGEKWLYSLDGARGFESLFVLSLSSLSLCLSFSSSSTSWVVQSKRERERERGPASSAASPSLSPTAVPKRAECISGDAAYSLTSREREREREREPGTIEYMAATCVAQRWSFLFLSLSYPSLYIYIPNCPLFLSWPVVRFIWNRDMLWSPCRCVSDFSLMPARQFSSIDWVYAKRV